VEASFASANEDGTVGSYTNTICRPGGPARKFLSYLRATCTVALSDAKGAAKTPVNYLDTSFLKVI
jgi:hypothetical protein